jgi:hypothetical protein
VKPPVPVVPVPDIKNNVKDPCLKKMVDAAIKSDIVFDLKQTMNSIFNANTDFNLEFVDNALASNLDGLTDAVQSGGIPAAPNSQRIILTTLSLQITLNSTTLPNASKEYVTATILHEVLHAYFIESHVAFDHQVMFEQYIPWYTSILKTMYPGMDENDMLGLAYGGLQDAPSYIGTLTTLQKQSYKDANERYKSGAKGTPCTK